MRSLALLLLLANVAVFGYWFSYAPPVQSQTIEKPLSPPESLRLSLLSETDDMMLPDDAAAAVQVSSISLDEEQDAVLDSTADVEETQEAAVVETDAAHETLADTATDIENAQQAQAPEQRMPEPDTSAPATATDETQTTPMSQEALADEILAQLKAQQMQAAEERTEPVVVAMNNEPPTETDIAVSDDVPVDDPTTDTTPAIPPSTSSSRLPQGVLNVLSRVGAIRFTHVHEDTPANSADANTQSLSAQSVGTRGAELTMSDAVGEPEQPDSEPVEKAENKLRVQLSSEKIIADAPAANPFAAALARTQAVTAIAAPRPVPVAPVAPTSTTNNTDPMVVSPSAEPATQAPPANTLSTKSLPVDTAPEIITAPSPAPKASPKPSNKTVCYRTGTFQKRSAAEYAQRWLQARDVSAKIHQQGKRVKVNTRVYLSPFPSLQNARYAAQQLRKNGVQDLRILTQGALKYAISLGVYRKDSSVQRRLAELRQKGYIEVKTQPNYQGEESFWLKLRLSEAQSGIISDFAAALKILKPRSTTCR